MEKLDPCDLATIMMIKDHYDDIDDDQDDGVLDYDQDGQHEQNGLPGSLLSLPTAR